MSENETSYFPDFGQELGAAVNDRLHSYIGAQVVAGIQANEAARILQGRVDFLNDRLANAKRGLVDLEGEIEALRAQVATAQGTKERPVADEPYIEQALSRAETDAVSAAVDDLPV